MERPPERKAPSPLINTTVSLGFILFKEIAKDTPSPNKLNEPGCIILDKIFPFWATKFAAISDQKWVLPPSNTK